MTFVTMPDDVYKDSYIHIKTDTLCVLGKYQIAFGKLHGRVDSH